MKEFKKGSKYFLNSDKSFEIKQLEETDLGKTYEFIASKEIEDRDGDTVLIDGIDLKNLGKNMPSLFNHNPHFVIGHIIEAKKVKKELRVTIFVLKDAVMPSGVKIIDAIDAGSLNAVSIGFMINEWKAKDADNIWGGWTIEKCELLEVSIVSIPANPAALRIKGLVNGMSDDDFEKIIKSVDLAVNSLNADILPVHDIKDWKVEEALARVKEWSKGEDGEIDIEKYKSAFMYSKSEDLDGHLFQFADVVDDKLVAVKSAVSELYKALDTEDNKDIPKVKKNEIKSIIKTYSEQSIVEPTVVAVDDTKGFEAFSKALSKKLSEQLEKFAKEILEKTLSSDQISELVEKKLKEASEKNKDNGLDYASIVKNLK